MAVLYAFLVLMRGSSAPALGSTHLDLFAGRDSSNVTEMLPQVEIQGLDAKMANAPLETLGLMPTGHAACQQ